MRRLHESGYAVSATEEALDGEAMRRLEAAGLSDDPMCEDYDMMREQIEAER